MMKKSKLRSSNSNSSRISSSSSKSHPLTCKLRPTLPTKPNECRRLSRIWKY